MVEPNAILAINSLDRYTSTLIETDTYLQGRWGLIEPFKISIASGVPIVGATLEFTTGIGFPVPPPGDQVRILTVTPFPGNLYQITINYPVTQNQINNALIYQLYTFAAANQPVSNALVAQYNDLGPYSNNFTIQSPGALIYGYINRIVVSQIQLSYNIPTINRNLNDTFYIYTAAGDLVPITIPHGYYYADELAATMQTLIRANATLAPFTMTVVFVPRDGFVFTSTSSPPRLFCFPSPGLLRGEAQLSSNQISNVLKTYRLLGMSFGANAEFSLSTSQTSFEYPNFLYTPYIDIYSDILTNYQNIKDTNTSVSKPKGLVARVYVSGTGQNQTTGSVSALGTAPFVMTSDLNTPKIIRWSPDVAVPSIDFQLLDQYGDEIPGALDGFYTEFQMTLLCIEGRD